MTDPGKHNHATVTYLPDLLYTGGRFESGVGLACDSGGRIVSLTRAAGITGEIVRLNRRAVLPGMVNAHSHAFQRSLRGRTEYRTSSHDTFWTWREMMYSAATRLTPDDIRDVARMAFLEMALSGITAVGEFHYLHRTAEGEPYNDPNLLSKAVIGAAREVGIRIVLLRVAYARGGYRVEPNQRQLRFMESDAETYIRNTDALRNEVNRWDADTTWVGVAPHSIRAVPREYLRQVAEYAASMGRIPFHMHVAEQPADVKSCIEEHGQSPVEFLNHEDILTEYFTGVHAIHISEAEARLLANARATVCACPTTERNLGDGIVPAHVLFNAGVPVALGTDSQIQIDLLEDARELEYHLRLKELERTVLPPSGDYPQTALAARLFDCATINGARSIGAESGRLSPGSPADFFTVDLDDASIAGAAVADLISVVVFGLSRTAIKDVFVGGKQIVSEGRHAHQEETVTKFASLQKKLWAG
ncbi:MAG: hypothetical protein QOJ64_389 [Acidobacteriota bacterium]|jgi:formimidoylglutamate deiminase|nr:hypothetical protein [Acidobacteriota bacterium]